MSDIICPDCGSNLIATHYELQRIGRCPKCKDTKTVYKKMKTHTVRENLSEFLSITPIKGQDVHDVPIGTPVWIEMHTGDSTIVTFADVLVGFADGNMMFLSDLSFPLSTYNKDWRIWYTFKSFRPNELESPSYPWRQN